MNYDYWPEIYNGLGINPRLYWTNLIAKNMVDDMRNNSLWEEVYTLIIPGRIIATGFHDCYGMRKIYMDYDFKKRRA